MQMISNRTNAVVEAAITLLVHDAPDILAIGQSFESAMLPAIDDLLKNSYSAIVRAKNRLFEAKRSDEDEESEASAEELALRDWAALESDLEVARAEFSRSLTLSLNLINGFRRFRGNAEFAPADTSELMQLLRMLLGLPTEAELLRVGDYMRLGFEVEVCDADVPGVPRAAFKLSSPRSLGERKDYGYDDDDDLPF